MEYNQLKIRVLDLFAKSEFLASDEVRSLLYRSGVELSDKAVKMALMRYTRQGLFTRSKQAGVYHYRLTAKGSARREWLSTTR